MLESTFSAWLSSYRGKPHLLPMPSVVAIEERAKFLNFLMEVNRSVLVTKLHEFLLRKRELGIRKQARACVICFIRVYLWRKGVNIPVVARAKWRECLVFGDSDACNKRYV